MVTDQIETSIAGSAQGEVVYRERVAIRIELNTSVAAYTIHEVCGTSYASVGRRVILLTARVGC